MTPENVEELSCRIQNEGFDYAMVYYSSWTDIEDAKFHTLRDEFLSVRQKLCDYLTEQGVEDEEY